MVWPNQTLNGTFFRAVTKGVGIYFVRLETVYAFIKVEEVGVQCNDERVCYWGGVIFKAGSSFTSAAFPSYDC